MPPSAPWTLWATPATTLAQPADPACAVCRHASPPYHPLPSPLPAPLRTAIDPRRRGPPISADRLQPPPSARPRSTYTRITHCTCIAPHRTRHVKAVRFVSSLHVPFWLFPFSLFFAFSYFFLASVWLGWALAEARLARPTKGSSGTTLFVVLRARRSPVDMPVIAHVLSKGGVCGQGPRMCVCACAYACVSRSRQLHGVCHDHIDARACGLRHEEGGQEGILATPRTPTSSSGPATW